MKELLVSMERGGERIFVGRIRGKDSADACFAYSDAWLRDPAAGYEKAAELEARVLQSGGVALLD